MKKIALIIDDFSCGGGIERALSNFSRALSDEYEQYIISLYDDNSFSDKAKVCWEHNAKEVINLGFIKRSRFRTLLAMPFHALKLKRIKKDLSIDYSISFGYYSNDLNCRSMLGKTIVTVHIYFKRHLMYFLRYQKYKKADYIIGVSKKIRDSLVREYGFAPENTSYIYNMFDIKKINGSKPSLDPIMSRDDFKIAMVGRLEEQKAVHHAIYIISKIKKTTIKLYLFGEGKLKNQLEALAEKLNVKDRVIFMGYKENVYSYLKECNIFLMTSLYEGFPMVNVEAMACGLPVLSCDCLSGPQELLLGTNNQNINNVTETESGMIFPRFTNDYHTNEQIYAQVAKYIERLERDSNKIKLLKKGALNRACDFDVSNIMSEWKKII